MPRPRFRCAAPLVACAALALAACGGGGGGGEEAPPPPIGQQMADFSLPDVNGASTTGGTQVSPRDYLGTGSAFYFTRST